MRTGDDRAFERLYRRYHRRIASYIQGMVHDHARAEDITQDVFMSALRRMRDTDRPIAFKPWIYEIAKNACIDQFRRSRRAEEVSYDAEDALGSADYGKLVTKDPGPDVAVENKQSLDHLRGAFGGLSETHHEILVMRELEGLSYREIGERLGMTRPAVESTLFRARRRLTEEYEQLVTGERCQRVQSIIATASAGSLGARDKRRLARHVSYCQPCLRHARTSGMSSADLATTPLRQKIAGLLPLPAFLKRRLSGASGSGSGSGDMTSTVATWSTHASTVDPGALTTWGKAAATAATIVVAGVGAGAATGPDGAARAALGDVSALGRVLGDGAGPGAHPRSAAAAAPLLAPVTSGAVAPRQGTATGLTVPAAKDSGGAVAGGGSGQRSTTTAGRRDAGTTTKTSAAAPAGAPAPRLGTPSASDTTQQAAASDPVGTTLKRLTGGGTTAGSGSGSGSGSSGGGAPSGKPGLPSAQLPASLPPLPAAPAPTQAPASAPSAGGDPAGAAAEQTQKAVGEAVDKVRDAVSGALGGK